MLHRIGLFNQAPQSPTPLLVAPPVGSNMEMQKAAPILHAPPGAHAHPVSAMNSKHRLSARLFAASFGAGEEPMDRLSALFELIRQHPALSTGVAFVAVVAYYLARRKPRIVREADRQLEELRRKRQGHYDKLRPPR
jgi:hypothetical protein